MDYLSVYLGPVVTVTSILFSYYGIRRQLRSQLYSHYSRLYYDIMLEMMNNSGNKEKCEEIAEVYIDLCSEEFQLHLQNRISEEVWRQWSEGILYTLSKPVYAPIWEKVSQGGYYDRNFVEFVKNKGEDASHPRQKHFR